MKWVDSSPDLSAPIWPADRPLPAPAVARRPLVLVPAAVHRQVLAQLRRAPIEDGGLLLGVPYRLADVDSPSDSDRGADRVGGGWIVDLHHAVPAPSAVGTTVSLRMDSRIWSAASAWLESARGECPALRVVGWYHSHPGFGAFFSDTDRRTQAAFFREPYSVGWCIDPSDDSHAWFVGATSAAALAQWC